VVTRPPYATKGTIEVKQSPSYALTGWAQGARCQPARLARRPSQPCNHVYIPPEATPPTETLAVVLSQFHPAAPRRGFLFLGSSSWQLAKAILPPPPPPPRI